LVLLLLSSAFILLHCIVSICTVLYGTLPASASVANNFHHLETEARPGSTYIHCHLAGALNRKWML